MWGVTVRQPYAALIAAGVKWTETRTQPAPKNRLGTRVFIHAGKSRPVDGMILGDGDWKVFRAAVSGDLDEVQHYAEGFEGAPASPLRLHYGAIVATAVLTHSIPVLERAPVLGHGGITIDGTEYLTYHERGANGEWLHHPISDQHPLGHWREPDHGRIRTWAWFLADIQPLIVPIPASGKQGWWQHPVHAQGGIVKPGVYMVGES